MKLFLSLLITVVSLPAFALDKFVHPTCNLTIVGGSENDRNRAAAALSNKGYNPLREATANLDRLELTIDTVRNHGAELAPDKVEVEDQSFSYRLDWNGKNKITLAFIDENFDCIQLIQDDRYSGRCWDVFKRNERLLLNTLPNCKLEN